MLIPFSILDTFRRDEPSLKGRNFLVRPRKSFDSFDEFDRIGQWEGIEVDMIVIAVVESVCMFLGGSWGLICFLPLAAH